MQSVPRLRFARRAFTPRRTDELAKTDRDYSPSTAQTCATTRASSATNTSDDHSAINGKTTKRSTTKKKRRDPTVSFAAETPATAPSLYLNETPPSSAASSAAASTSAASSSAALSQTGDVSVRGQEPSFGHYKGGVDAAATKSTEDVHFELPRDRTEELRESEESSPHTSPLHDSQAINEQFEQRGSLSNPETPRKVPVRLTDPSHVDSSLTSTKAIIVPQKDEATVRAMERSVERSVGRGIASVETPDAGEEVEGKKPEVEKGSSEEVKRWKAMEAELHRVIEKKDCQVSNKALMFLITDVIGYMERVKARPEVLICRRGSSGGGSRGQGGSCRFVSNKLAMKERSKIDDILAEPHAKLFVSETLKKPEATAEYIETFLNEFKGGARAGRSGLGSNFKSLQEMPVVMFSEMPLKPEDQARYVVGQGNMKWKTHCPCICPIVIEIVFQDWNADEGRPDTDPFGRVLENLEYAGALLSRLGSDWRVHRIRSFAESSRKFGDLLPAMKNVDANLLKKAGWSDVNVKNSTIRWKNLQGGLILSYLSGIAEGSLDKTLALVYDGDNHKQWIPFLTDTRRDFSMSDMSFALKYAVALPWPLNNRALTLLGMATDSLRQPPLNSIQMWGGNVPASATSCFGIPLNQDRQAVAMEMPVLSFSLSPITKDTTSVTMIAVMDVKINFLPTALQNYMAKHMATKMFGNVQHLCKNFERTSYKQILDDNKELFDELLRP